LRALEHYVQANKSKKQDGIEENELKQYLQVQREARVKILSSQQSMHLHMFSLNHVIQLRSCA